MRLKSRFAAVLMGIACASAPAAAQQQDQLDRADPGRQERELPQLPERDKPAPPPVVTKGETAITTEGSVFARSIRIDGLTEIAPDLFEPVIADFAGRRLDRADLRALAGGIASVARAEDYPFATAWVPAQSLADGVLVVRLEEGRVDAIRVEDDDGAVERMLRPLASGRPVRGAALERQLLLAGDLPGVSIRKTRFERNGAGGVLVVTARRDTIRGRAALDNYASSRLGPVRTRVRVDFNGLVAGDDRVSLEGVVTPFDPREFQLVAAGFDKGLGASGAVVSLSGYYAHTRPGGSLRDRRTSGESYRATAGVTYPLVRMREAGLWLGGDFYHRRSMQSQRDARVRDDRVTAISLETSGYLRAAGGFLNGRARVTRGLDLFNATRRGDPLASRRDGDARFTKLEAGIGWTGELAPRTSLKVAAEGQLASRALLSAEEFGIGGPRFLRAYDYSERQGDEGAAGFIELRYDLVESKRAAVRGVQLYGFVDGGVTRDIGRTGSDSLSSAGVGVRTKMFKGLYADIEAAFPLSHARDASGDRSPRIGVELRALF